MEKFLLFLFLSSLKVLRYFLNSLELLREMMNQNMFEEMAFQDILELENENEFKDIRRS